MAFSGPLSAVSINTGVALPVARMLFKNVRPSIPDIMRSRMIASMDILLSTSVAFSAEDDVITLKCSLRKPDARALRNISSSSIIKMVLFINLSVICRLELVFMNSRKTVYLFNGSTAYSPGCIVRMALLAPIMSSSYVAARNCMLPVANSVLNSA